MFGNVRNRKINLLNDLRLMEEKRNSGYLSEEDGSKLVEVKATLEKTMYWRRSLGEKKSGALWLKEGDKKTSFSPSFLILIIAVFVLQI